MVDRERDTLEAVCKGGLSYIGYSCQKPNLTVDATNLFSWETFAVLLVVLADVDEVVAFEFTDGHTTEMAELRRLEHQLWLHEDGLGPKLNPRVLAQGCD